MLFHPNSPDFSTIPGVFYILSKKIEVPDEPIFAPPELQLIISKNSKSLEDCETVPIMEKNKRVKGR